MANLTPVLRSRGSSPRRSACLRLLLICLGSACTSSTDAAPCLHCNVVLISVDTLRKDHVGLYGYDRETTPNIDAFFSNGTIYDFPVTAAPCTIPSVLQFLTSDLDYRDESPRIAEILRNGGYRTAAFVAQAFFFQDGDPDEKYARGFDSFISPGYVPTEDLREVPTADQISDAATRWLAEHGGSGRFFLWLHYFDPHDPYSPPLEHRSFVGPAQRPIDHRAVLTRAVAEHPEWVVREWTRAGRIFTPEDVARLVGMYDGEIRFVDAQIGRVLGRLEELGLIGQTVVVLTADHGERLGENGTWDHCASLHGRELNVPLMITSRGRGVPESGHRPGLATTLDILPTISALTGVRDGSAHAGFSLLSDVSTRYVVAIYGTEVAVLRYPWKLRIGRGRGPRLLRMDDPEELEDLARVYPAVTARLSSLIDVRAVELTRQRAAETRERLRSLGYIE